MLCNWYGKKIRKKLKNRDTFITKYSLKTNREREIKPIQFNFLGYKYKTNW